MQYQFQFVSSLEKIFFDPRDDLYVQTSGSMLKNERYSFQLYAYAQGAPDPRIYASIEIDSPIREYLSVYRVGYVPSTLACLPQCKDDDYLSKRPGLFPDPLYPITDGKIELADTQTRAFWFVIEPNGSVSGTFPIHVRIKDKEGQLIGDLTYTIEIIDALLPEQTLINTGWFHTDCLAVAHHVEILSDAHFALLEKYIRLYASFGHNMILTPVFTPPLDTAVGGERPTVQLVDVTESGGEYRFDFSMLKRWLDMCRACGIRYFEISHLFTQWGAKHAPKVMAHTNTGYRRIFGWDTDAAGPEYTAFLQAFLPALTAFLQQQGVLDCCYFHVSDEPLMEHLEQYQAVKAIIAPYIRQDRHMDALSEYALYQTGAVGKPVVATNHIQPFLEHQVPGLWAYYCTAQGDFVANRYMAMPSYRSRVLGQQLYKHQIEGFLQWGFNFWNAQFSIHAIDPFAVTDADGAFQSGDAFLVYPCGQDGNPICSLRLYVFADALQDMRALQLLESKIGRDAVLELLPGIIGFDQYPRSIDYIVSLRETINQKIKESHQL